MATMRFTNVGLPVPLHEALRREAFETRASLAHVLRRAAELYLSLPRGPCPYCGAYAVLHRELVALAGEAAGHEPGCRFAFVRALADAEEGRP